MRTKTFAVLLAAFVLLAVFGANALAQSGVAGWFDFETNVKMWGDLLVMDDVVVTDQLSAADLTLSDDLSVGDDFDLGGWAQVDAQTAISVTAGAIITPTGTLQRLESGGAVTTSTAHAIANGATMGDLLILINMNATNTITVDGTGGNVECKTDKVLGAKDTLMLMWGGSDWYCLSLADNS